MGVGDIVAAFVGDGETSPVGLVVTVVGIDGLTVGEPTPVVGIGVGDCCVTPACLYNKTNATSIIRIMTIAVKTPLFINHSYKTC